MRKLKTAALLQTGILLLLLPLLAGCARFSKRVPTVALVAGKPGINDPLIAAFKKVLSEGGYREGQGVCYVERTLATETPGQMFPDLLRRKVDLIFCQSTGSALRALPFLKDGDIPLVFVAHDAVRTGIVQDRTRHGNVVGVEIVQHTAKSLETLRFVMPRLKRIFVVYDPVDPGLAHNFNELMAECGKAGIRVLSTEVRSREELVSALRNIPAAAEALFGLPSACYLPFHADFVEAALARRIPFMSAADASINPGAMLDLGIDYRSMGKQAGGLALKILGGFPASHLPLEQAEFFFTVNLAAAQEIGFTVPDRVLELADRIVR